ncbi:hypothetical protein P171DRAFT_437883 [Karstenula rhodostoma CBS 690.94]|uniref:Uncharacterized protein n=1 Tax=Karstenula rhodostoma CBS 690.94 TaxID=1392251 RepID=A0A9P4U4R2_9PLEO|nr:hypothetical protein P171DRAFT_437883 [Karstenula rhodostoma CBS 690.94]
MMATPHVLCRQPGLGSFEYADGDLIDEELSLDPRTGSVVANIDMWLISFKPREDVRNGRGVLILGGGQSDPYGPGCGSWNLAKWMRLLGFHAFILLKQLNNGSKDPFRDSKLGSEHVRLALDIISERALPEDSLGICGFGLCFHLASALFTSDPQSWIAPETYFALKGIAFVIMGNVPISDCQVNQRELDSPNKREVRNYHPRYSQPYRYPPPAFYANSNHQHFDMFPQLLFQEIAKRKAELERHEYATSTYESSDGEDIYSDLLGQSASGWFDSCETWMRTMGFLVTENPPPEMHRSRHEASVSTHPGGRQPATSATANTRHPTNASTPGNTRGGVGRISMVSSNNGDGNQRKRRRR